ncbi:IS3 family transposase [Corynebacterium diphtheriae]|uniref:IS3 family transposase n=1 Tax=Corynebacterium diphtheriae TaxID=1717 RepID=UPI0028A70A06|nr:IS3 family transposase [Corynebacterium diphtheriae]
MVEHSGFSCGYRRVWIQLKKLGIKVSEKVVRRIISAEGLTVRYVKKRCCYSSYRGEISDAPPNLVKRNFHAETPSLLWLTDISWFPADGRENILLGVSGLFRWKDCPGNNEPTPQSAAC